MDSFRRSASITFIINLQEIGGFRPALAQNHFISVIYNARRAAMMPLAAGKLSFRTKSNGNSNQPYGQKNR
jgi:hypothetical protein